MRVLIDAAHAADVWMLGAVEDRLVAAGAETMWLSRPGKDSVVELLDARGARHVRGPEAGTTAVSLARELVSRDWRAWRTVRQFDPDVVITRSPAGVHAARLARRPVLYDTDDGPEAGFLFRMAAPLATVVTSPRATTQECGRDHRRYDGYKELFYLHPDRFTPDPSIRAEAGFFAEIDRVLLDVDAAEAEHLDARQRMLDACGDPVDDLVGWIVELAESGPRRRGS